ncbi:hypothetical protein J537_2894 [Acinetobacter baumannii 1437282]|nr:hypothetical protein J537_2894 [Acinetobacter baumannii 1437282]
MNEIKCFKIELKNVPNPAYWLSCLLLTWMRWVTSGQQIHKKTPQLR